MAYGRQQPARPRPFVFSYGTRYLLVAVGVGLAAAGLLGRYIAPLPFVVAWWLVSSLSTLSLCALDKLLAITTDRGAVGRVPERLLLGLAWLGGFAGLSAGMVLTRHKTTKGRFWVLPVAAGLLHVGAAVHWRLL